MEKNLGEYRVRTFTQEDRTRFPGVKPFSCRPMDNSYGVNVLPLYVEYPNGNVGIFGRDRFEITTENGDVYATDKQEGGGYAFPIAFEMARAFMYFSGERLIESLTYYNFKLQS